MQAHWRETTVGEHGELILEGLPFEPGQSVEANDPIMVLEAMKMETNVTAHGAGKVKNVRVAQGDSVKVNQVVVEFE